MSFFEYTSVMVAVVLALGIARILSAVGELLVERRSTRAYWVHGLWLFFYFLLHLRIWWGYWDVRDSPPTLLPAFIFMLLGPALAYLGAYLLVPGHFPDDADAHFYAVRKPFFGIGLTSLLVALATPTVLGYQMPLGFSAGAGIGLLPLTLGLASANRRLQGAVVVLVFTSFVANFMSRMVAGAFTPG